MFFFIFLRQCANVIVFITFPCTATSKNKELFDEFQKFMARKGAAKFDSGIQETSTRIQIEPRKQAPPPPMPPANISPGHLQNRTVQHIGTPTHVACPQQATHIFSSSMALATAMSSMAWGERKQLHTKMTDLLEVFTLSCFQTKQMSQNRCRMEICNRFLQFFTTRFYIVFRFLVLHNRKNFLIMFHTSPVSNSHLPSFRFTPLVSEYSPSFRFTLVPLH